jgi:hypothetical protein
VTSQPHEAQAIPEPWSGVPSPLDTVADMRTTAKWIIGAAAAVGAALLGGAPLAAVGKIQGVGSAAEALAGLVIGLTGVGWAIWHTAEALIPPVTTLAMLETAPLAELQKQIAADPAGFYGPFGTSVAEVQAACQRFDTAAARAAVMLAAEPDAARQRILTQGIADAAANAMQARARMGWLLALAHAWRVRDLLRRTRLHAFAGAAVAAIGGVIFMAATTANPATSRCASPAPIVTAPGALPVYPTLSPTDRVKTQWPVPRGARLCPDRDS